ncbi:MAG TPA: diacylglycerol kinase family protein [Ktedonobacteraceae bacterium]|jgi:YegS/Rv2252/BmrU family lipid kinase|nr:diacylglycerol kinase family protein [Ktedonobacteraceae bacterium]
MQQDATQQGASSFKLSQRFAVIIANPVSGFFLNNAQRFSETLFFLRKHGWRAELWYTEAPGDGQRLAQKAVEQGADVVIAAGGDGTINEIIQVLAGSETALGVLPTGTVNVWAREMGIPLNTAQAQKILVEGKTRRIDLGQVNDRYFLLMVGIGLDGEVTQAVERRPLKRLGVLGYALVALWYGPGYRGFPVVVHNNGYVMRTRAMQVFIGNTQLYAGALKFTWQAKCDDGLLDLCIVRRRNLWGRILILWDFLRRRGRDRWVRYQTFTEIKIETPQPVAFQIDGDMGGYTPATFRVVPGALKVIVPEQAPAELFVNAAD